VLDSCKLAALEDTAMANPGPGVSTVQEPDDGQARAVGNTYPGTPLWVKVSGIVALVVLLLVVLVMVLFGGNHGPMRHIPSGSGPDTPSLTAVRA